MTRTLALLSAAAAIALPLAAMAQTPAPAPAPRTATVNNVQINSVTASPASPGSRVVDTREGLLAKLRNARSAMPTLTLPPATTGNN